MQATLTFENGAYRAMEEDTIRQEIYRRYPWADSGKVHQIADAMNAIVHVEKFALAPPCWLDGRIDPVASEQLVLKNGILDLASGNLTPHDNNFFTRNVLPFDFDPNAPLPERWLRFLNEIWPDEEDCRAALQQMFGYLLTPDTSQQKIFVLVGPTRSGKGTIGRVLRSLLGERNVCMPSMNSLGNDFGMQCMIGKQLALMSDMRFGQKTDKAAVMEILLRISGEDPVNVHRKNKPDWEGTLGVRFVTMSNEAPTLNDPSGALLGRYIVLQMRQSFLGQEDHTLDAQLAKELPGILNYAIAGRRELLRKGRLVQPLSSGDLTDAMRRLSSPEAAFVEDECTLEREGRTTKDDLYERFKAWCKNQEITHVISKEVFAKNLLTAFGRYVGTAKPLINGRRTPVFTGIVLYRDRPPF